MFSVADAKACPKVGAKTSPGWVHCWLNSYEVGHLYICLWDGGSLILLYFGDQSSLHDNPNSHHLHQFIKVVSFLFHTFLQNNVFMLKSHFRAERASLSMIYS